MKKHTYCIVLLAGLLWNARAQTCYDGYLQKGVSHYQNENFDAAKRMFEEANKCDGRDMARKEADQYLAMVEGIDLFKKGKYEPSKTKFNEAAKCRKLATEASNYLGKIRNIQKTKPEPSSKGGQIDTAPLPYPPVPPTDWAKRRHDSIQQVAHREDSIRHIQEEATKKKKRQDSIDVAWRLADGCMTVYAYARFRDNYPGVNTEQVEQKIQNLKQRERIKQPDLILVQKGRHSVGLLETFPQNKYIDHWVKFKETYMGTSEVSNEEFCLFLNEMGDQDAAGRPYIRLDPKCKIQKSVCGYSVLRNFEDSPVVFVTWYGAIAYCAWLNEKFKENYYLPSEAELDYICRNPNGENWLDVDLKDNTPWVNFKGRNTGPSGLVKCREYRPNAFGFYHAIGNVSEWAADDWVEDHTKLPTDGSPYLVGSQDQKVVKGGNANTLLRNCFFNNRAKMNARDASEWVGFRVAKRKN